MNNCTLVNAYIQNKAFEMQTVCIRSVSTRCYVLQKRRVCKAQSFDTSFASIGTMALSLQPFGDRGIVLGKREGGAQSVCKEYSSMPLGYHAKTEFLRAEGDPFKSVNTRFLVFPKPTKVEKAGFQRLAKYVRNIRPSLDLRKIRKGRKVFIVPRVIPQKKRQLSGVKDILSLYLLDFSRWRDRGTPLSVESNLASIQHHNPERAQTSTSVANFLQVRSKTSFLSSEAIEAQPLPSDKPKGFVKHFKQKGQRPLAFPIFREVPTKAKRFVLSYKKQDTHKPFEMQTFGLCKHNQTNCLSVPEHPSDKSNFSSISVLENMDKSRRSQKQYSLLRVHKDTCSYRLSSSLRRYIEAALSPRATMEKGDVQSNNQVCVQNKKRNYRNIFANRGYIRMSWWL